MNVIVDRSFERDTDKIKDKKLLRLATYIDSCTQVNSATELKSLKKMKGFPYHFRIRIGEYRAGVLIKADQITFVRFLHRKDIYRFFP